MAICRPLEARRVAAGPRNTGLAAAAAFLGSALVELPAAWTYSIARFDCPDTYYLLDHLPAPGLRLIMLNGAILLRHVGSTPRKRQHYIGVTQSSGRLSS